MKILHFADAHIDIATHGRHDPQTGLPVRMHDFLKSLDAIIDAAIEERVDLVLFAGDAYKDRTPVPTFQREWDRGILKLSRAGIRTLLLVGNHDLSPAVGRAHAMQEFETLPVPHIHVASRPMFLTPDDLEGLPLQVMALPWVSRSSMMAALALSGSDPEKVFVELENRLNELVDLWFEEKVDPSIPVILTAHASVQGAKLGGERSVMLGADLILPGSLVKDPRFSYVALGHIHKPQDLNEGSQPPVIYPGSIERVDFGEVEDDKFFVVATVERGEDTTVEWRALPGRRFIDRRVEVKAAEDLPNSPIDALPPQAELDNAIVRLIIEYAAEWEPLLNEQAIRDYAENAFEFHLIRRPKRQARIRLPNNQAIASLTPGELLDQYWKSVKTDEVEEDELMDMAKKIIAAVSGMSD